jgi:hypothetical protein
MTQTWWPLSSLDESSEDSFFSLENSNFRFVSDLGFRGVIAGYGITTET